MIVIAVIAILMTVTMRFWSKRIDDLGSQAGKEQFVTAYDRLYSQAVTSNYHEGIRYDVLHITLNSWADSLSYAYDSGIYTSISIATPVMLSWLQLDGSNINEANLDLQPYTLWCWILGSSENEPSTWAAITFTLVVKGQKNYCFTIPSTTCKLIEIQCWT